MRSKPTDGTARRIVRAMGELYAVSKQDVADMFGISLRHANRFISRLEAEKIIYLRYRQNRFYYYSLTKRKL